MPARRVASTYSIAGLTYENGCSASNTTGRLTSENQNRITHTDEGFQMPFISVGKENTKDIEIYYKDWGSGQPVVFSHGWPLSADDWDAQMLFFFKHGYRVIAHDRRGHGRSTQTGGGHDMDHYADHLVALTKPHDLKRDLTEDLKKITGPVLVMHGDDDQIVPYADSAPLSAKLLKNSTLKTYKGFPHGMPTTEADTINADLLTFLRA